MLESGVPAGSITEEHQTAGRQIIWLRTSRCRSGDPAARSSGAGHLRRHRRARRKDEELAATVITWSRSWRSSPGAVVRALPVRVGDWWEDMGRFPSSAAPRRVVTRERFPGVFRALGRDSRRPWDRAIRWVEEDLDETVGAIRDLSTAKVWNLIRAEMRCPPRWPDCAPSARQATRSPTRPARSSSSRRAHRHHSPQAFETGAGRSERPKRPAEPERLPGQHESESVPR